MQTLLYAARWYRLKALCLFVWASFHPSFSAEHPKPSATALAGAIADAVLFDPSPIYGDEEHEAALAAEYAVRESGLQMHVIGDHGEAHGAFQLHQRAGDGTPEEQIAAWLKLLHNGAVICPISPAAPLSGGCRAARKLADRRAKVAFEALDSFLKKDESAASAEEAAAPAAATVPAGGANPAL